MLIERLSAIKVLNDDLLDSEVPNSGAVRESPYREHFLREARAVNRINHPNIVEISDYGEATVTLEGGIRRTVVYLVMEYVPGESLQKVIARAPLSAVRAIPIVSQVAQALARAHQTGVIHRDIKPENILLVTRKGGGDLAKLTDFGVAKITHVGSTAASVEQVLGTPGYIAPEYLLGETTIDGRADLYSLGVVLYQALTGVLPFDARDDAELLTRPLSEDPVPAGMRTRDLSPALEDLIMRSISRRADDRPHDAFRFLDELERIAGTLGVSVSLPPQGTFPAAGVPFSVDTIDDEPPPSIFLPSIPEPPRLGVATPQAMVERWRTHWSALEARVDRRRDLPDKVHDVMHRAALLVEGLDRAATIVGATQRALDQLETEAREFRGSLGNAIDVLAHDLSKAHTRVLDLTRLRAQIYLKKRHATDAREADSLAWELAACDDERRNGQAIRDDLGHQIGALQDRLFQRNNAHESEVQRTIAALEGESAGMATLHRELEMLSAEVARSLGLTVA